MVIFAVVVASAIFPIVFVGLSQHGSDHRKVLKAIQGLDAREIKELHVYSDDWPRGSPSIIVDQEKISLLLASLKSGKRYFANHDQDNGFRRVVFLEPQHLQFSVYQKEGDTGAVIVGLGELTGETHYRSFGDIRCILPSAWKNLAGKK